MQTYTFLMVCLALLATARRLPAGAEAFDPFAGASPAETNPSASDAVVDLGSELETSRSAGSATALRPWDGFVSTSVKGQGPTIGRVQFTNDDISMVFQVVSDASGWSIFPSEKVKQKITLYASDITAGDLLDWAVTMAGFVYVKQGNIISVMTYEDYMTYYGVVKRTITLLYRDAREVANVVSQFVTPRGKLIPDPRTQTLVIYEVPSNLSMLEEIIRKIDLAPDRKVVRVIKLFHADAVELAEHLEEIFTTLEAVEEDKKILDHVRTPRASSQPALATTTELLSAQNQVTIHPVPRTNHLVLRGYPADLERVEELVHQLDIPGELITRHYQVIHLTASELLSSLEESLGLYGRDGRGRAAAAGGSRRRASRAAGTGESPQCERVRLSVLSENNSIVVTAPLAVHRQVARFLELCDTPPVEIAGGIRHYRLENASAAEVAQILRDLIEQQDTRADQGRLHVGTAPGVSVTGPGEQTPSAPPGPSPQPRPAGSTGETKTGGGLIEVAGERRTEKPRITFSEATNTVIIQATVREHAQFQQIIAELDRQRPQVLIEAIIVELRGNQDIDVGVELESYQTPGDSAGHLLFTSFGLSTIDPATGRRAPAGLPGGTAVITRADEIPLILHALESTGKARIRSAPRLLVNDNTQGRVQSIAEEPYTQINASDTVATTSFGGFVQAGTQLTVTPHVSNDDYLRLEYEITLNSFRGGSTDPSLPPARDTSTIASQATVPDGCTLIVAGLSHRTNRRDKDQLPWLGDLPLIGPLFQRNTTTQSDTRLYVFIRPTILRDSQFRELKAISAQDRLKAGEKDDEPTNPLLDVGEG